MYSFNYVGCVSFTTAKLTEGGQFSILVSSLSTTLNIFGDYKTVAAFTFSYFDCSEWKTHLVYVYIYIYIYIYIKHLFLSLDGITVRVFFGRNIKRRRACMVMMRIIVAFLGQIFL